MKIVIDPATNQPLHQRTNSWHAWRMGVIGGSDAAVIDGTMPPEYGRSLRKLFYEKNGVVIPDASDKTFIYDMGEKLERIARADIWNLHNVEIYPVCVESSKDNRIGASLDGYHPEIGLVEVKFVGAAVIEHAAANRDNARLAIPAHHYTQIQHQIMAAEDPRAIWFAGDPKARCLMINVPADYEYIESLMLKELKFLNDLESGIEPPLGENEFLELSDCSLFRSIEAVKNEADTSKGKAVQERWNALKESIITTHNHPRVRCLGWSVQRTKSGIQCRRSE